VCDDAARDRRLIEVTTDATLAVLECCPTDGLDTVLQQRVGADSVAPLALEGYLEPGRVSAERSPARDIRVRAQRPIASLDKVRVVLQ